MTTTESAITLNRHPAKPWEKRWDSIYTELLGTQIRLVHGKKYVTRTIETGTGEPLILIHGSGGSAESWFRNIRNLADNHGFHVYAIDAMYHGFSSKEPVTDDRVGTQVEHLLDFMDAEGIEKAHIEGESMGSFITFRMALEHPERCLKVVLNTGARINFKRTFGPGGQPPEALPTLTRELIANPTPETVRHRMQWLMSAPERVDEELVALRLRFFSMPELREAQRQTGPGSESAARAAPPYEEEDCARITVPTMVFWTEFNPSSGPDVGEHLASLIPGAKYFCMKDAAHWPQYEHPEEHDQVIADFLKGRL